MFRFETSLLEPADVSKWTQDVVILGFATEVAGVPEDQLKYDKEGALCFGCHSYL